MLDDRLLHTFAYSISLTPILEGDAQFDPAVEWSKHGHCRLLTRHWVFCSHWAVDERGLLRESISRVDGEGVIGCFPAFSVPDDVETFTYQSRAVSMAGGWMMGHLRFTFEGGNSLEVAPSSTFNVELPKIVFNLMSDSF